MSSPNCFLQFFMDPLQTVCFLYTIGLGVGNFSVVVLDVYMGDIANILIGKSLRFPGVAKGSSV